ncbi:MAG: DUF2752 domain-containing protein [Bacteroidetes bacterium]|jgi:hypothetical protein|nr:DUF2752 domain-containing protein [Bacteroidota bacterium]
MTQSRRKLYTLLFLSCLAGYIWLYVGSTKNPAENHSVGVCLIKHTTNMPCPSCGSTRSVLSITRGEFSDALQTNPLGYVIALIMLLLPLWIVTDLVFNKRTLFDGYQKMEIVLKKPQIAIPLIALVLINWIWNITKGL